MSLTVLKKIQKRFKSCGSDTSNILIPLFSVCSPSLLKLIIIQNFIPVSKNPRQSNPEIKNGSLFMAKNVNVLCWVRFLDALSNFQRVESDQQHVYMEVGDPR